MVKIAMEISDEAHIKLLEIQLDRKKKKVEPSAINKIAAEILIKALEKENPTE
jgi:hypothetical protein